MRATLLLPFCLLSLPSSHLVLLSEIREEREKKAKWTLLWWGCVWNRRRRGSFVKVVVVVASIGSLQCHCLFF